MIPRFIRLSGMTRENRNQMIWRVKEAIQRADADLTDFQMFSNIAVSINFEIAAGNLEKLVAALAAENFLLPESLEELEEYARKLPALGEKTRAAEVTCLLHLTFIHDEPDLRIDSPAIPG